MKRDAGWGGAVCPAAAWFTRFKVPLLPAGVPRSEAAYPKGGEGRRQWEITRG
jgi:hypothetical protein